MDDFAILFLGPLAFVVMFCISLGIGLLEILLNKKKQENKAEYQVYQTESDKDLAKKQTEINRQMDEKEMFQRKFSIMTICTWLFGLSSVLLLLLKIVLV